MKVTIPGFTRLFRAFSKKAKNPESLPSPSPRKETTIDRMAQASARVINPMGRIL